MSISPLLTRSVSKRFTKQNTFSYQYLSYIPNQNLKKMVELILARTKTKQIIDAIDDYLTQIIEIDYFKQLKSLLNQNDYYLLLEKLKIEYRLGKSVIIEKRKRNDYFYVILHGAVLVLDNMVVENKNQNQETPQQDKYQNRYIDKYQVKYQIINELKEGDGFGQTSLLSHKRQATARVEAKTDCLFITIDYQTYIRIISKITIFKKQQIVNTLSRLSVFYGIHRNSIKDLIIELQEIKYGLNQTIYSQKDEHDAVYFIKSGMVEISQNGVKLMMLVQGQNFGLQYPYEENQDQESQQMMKTRIKRRMQDAISKSNDLVIYRLGFNRFKILQEYYEIFIKNLNKDYYNKKMISEKLVTNHSTIKKLISFSKIGIQQTKKSFVLKKKRKTRTISKTPQWWGTVDPPEEDKMRMKQLQKQKQNQPSSGLLSRRIQQLKKLADMRHQSVPSQLEEQLSYRSHFKQLKSTLHQKTMSKVVANDQDQFEIRRKRIVPKMKKEKLVNYAKSTINCWDFGW